MPGIDIYGTEEDDVITALFPDDNIWGYEGNDFLTGGEGANFLFGDVGDDRLDGAAGDDLLDSGLGDDDLSGGAGNDIILGQDGRDRLSGGAGDDLLDGGLDADRLDGGTGSDTAVYRLFSFAVAIDLAAGIGPSGDVLTGIENAVAGYGDDRIIGDGSGNALDGWVGGDVLTGGGGADRFVVSAADHSGLGAAADRITDFSRGEGDRIDLAAIDADPAAAGDQAFRFIGSAAFTQHAGELRFVVSGGTTIVAGDIDGNGAADLEILLTGAVAMQAGDFLL
ncbi:calcium-binding protein [Inquilinus sp. CA228]|uniref:calcium-binding protein n=1 Tax=Inquilinus sp. CA228 TaxID=3455609 RepID=UPI003F8CFF40